jgi:hypothetical protein
MLSHIEEELYGLLTDLLPARVALPPGRTHVRKSRVKGSRTKMFIFLTGLRSTAVRQIPVGKHGEASQYFIAHHRICRPLAEQVQGCD